MGQQSTIKWFIRFRKVCCPKGKIALMGLGQVYQRLYQGNGETFARIILQLFGLDPNTGSLDFKVIKYVPMCMCSVKKMYMMLLLRNCVSGNC